MVWTVKLWILRRSSLVPRRLEDSSVTAASAIGGLVADRPRPHPASGCGCQAGQWSRDQVLRKLFLILILALPGAPFKFDILNLRETKKE